MAKSFAVEWADHGIRVNSLSPGYMRTPLVAAVLKGTELEAGWIEKTPMKRLGTPEDLKGAIVLLASDASKFVTGSDITVDVRLPMCPLVPLTSSLITSFII